MFYLLKLTLLIAEISVLAGVKIGWILGGIKKGLVGDWIAIVVYSLLCGFQGVYLGLNSAIRSPNLS